MEQDNPLGRVEAELKSLHEMQKMVHEGQNKVIMGLMALVAASLGIRFTETDISAEIHRSGSFIVITGAVFLFLAMAREFRNGKKFHPALLLFVVLHLLYGIPILIQGKIGLPTEILGVFGVFLGVAMGWMAWDVLGIDAMIRRRRGTPEEGA